MASVLSLIPVFPAHSVCFTTLWWINVTEPIVGLILIVTSVLTKKNSTLIQIGKNTIYSLECKLSLILAEKKLFNLKYGRFNSKWRYVKKISVFDTIVFYILSNRFRIIPSLGFSEITSIAVLVVFGLLALYLIWTTLVNDFKTLTWASIWYFPSMLLVQLVVRYLIIFILILATDKIPANIIQNSTNQSSLQNFGASIAGQVLPNMLVFIWAAIIAPLMENLFLFM